MELFALKHDLHRSSSCLIIVNSIKVFLNGRNAGKLIISSFHNSSPLTSLKSPMTSTFSGFQIEVEVFAAALPSIELFDKGRTGAILSVQNVQDIFFFSKILSLLKGNFIKKSSETSEFASILCYFILQSLFH